MSKNKKIIVTILISVLVIVAVGVIIYFVVNPNKDVKLFDETSTEDVNATIGIENNSDVDSKTNDDIIANLRALTSGLGNVSINNIQVSNAGSSNSASGKNHDSTKNDNSGTDSGLGSTQNGLSGTNFDNAGSQGTENANQNGNSNVDGGYGIPAEASGNNVGVVDLVLDLSLSPNEGGGLSVSQELQTRADQLAVNLINMQPPVQRATFNFSVQGESQVAKFVYERTGNNMFLMEFYIPDSF
ncbi:MAG: hypothetical protein K5644_02610 [Lachnospiraceae bacterium]|nr:hypothetical protein [Lachnospiraceae bacterium]